MSWFSSIVSDIGGEASHIAKSVAGEATHAVKSVGGEVGTVYAHVIRPALPVIATVGSAVIPGAQFLTPYLISSDIGLYGHAALTGGFHGLTEPNLGDYEAGAATAALYGAGQAYVAFTGATGGTATNSTQLLTNLGNPGYNALTNTFSNPIDELGNAASSVYNTFAGLGSDLTGAAGLAGGALQAYDTVRNIGGQPSVNILGQIQPTGLSGGSSGVLSGGSQQSQQELGGTSAGITGAAGGGIGLPGQSNSALLEVAAIAAIGGAILAS